MAKALLQKLGYRPENTGLITNLPWAMTPAFESVRRGDAPECFLGFCARASDVGPTAARLLANYRPGAHLWFAYPKLSGALASDLSRDRGWAPLNDADFLPVTQVAIDADWSGLRFRARSEIPTLTRRF